MRTLLGLAIVLVALSAEAVSIDFRQLNTNQFYTNGYQVKLRHYVNLKEVFTMHPFSQETNVWVDFSRTNSLGEELIYGTMTATNNVFLYGLSNCVRGSLVSFNVIAASTNRLLSISTNLIPHPDTNVWTLSGARYQVLLTTNHEARITFQSNDTFSAVCYLPEQ